jgi:hypothetical protein
MEDFTKILQQGKEQKSAENKQQINEFQVKVKKYSSDIQPKLKEGTYE